MKLCLKTGIKMKIIVYENKDQLGKVAAILIAAEILKPECVLGMATDSPLPIYKSLVDLYNQGDINFSKVRTFNLDEYVGLERTHEQSYYRFMFDNFFSK